MKARLFFVLSLVIALPLGLGGGLSTAPSGSIVPPDPLPVPNHDIAASLHSAPPMFIENVGQFDPRARFQARGGNGALWLAEDALWITLLERREPDFRSLEDFGSLSADDQPRQGVNIKLSFVGANPHPRLEPFHRLETHVSYFIGNDPARWHADVPVWSGVRYVDLYPGVDLEVSGEGGQWQPRLIAQPGADLSQVRLRVEGADAIALGGDYLRLTTAMGTFSLPLFKPVTSDRSPLPLVGEGARVTANDITAPFARGELTAVSSQDQPTSLLYSTYLGGNGDDEGWDIAADVSGAAYVTGWTMSYNFPITPGAFQTSCRDYPPYCYDVFVTKLNSSGSGLIYSTYLGGSSREYANGIAVDVSGAAYITGQTASTDFPTTAGAFQTTHHGGTCNALGFVWASNSAPTPTAFPTTYDNGAHPLPPPTPTPIPPACPDAFVTKLNTTGTALLYSTFLGGSNGDYGWGITVDVGGSAYVTGQTHSADFPTTPGAFQTVWGGGANCGGNPCPDAFVTKLNVAGSALTYSTFLGGNSGEVADHIAVDAGGVAYITGQASSLNFPTTPNAFQTTYQGGIADVFVTKLNAAGSALVYSTLLGGTGWDWGVGLAVDGDGAAYITGGTYSPNFPVTAGAFQTTCGGDPPCYYTDAFVTKINEGGSGLIYSTYLGGSYIDDGTSIALDASGAAYITGYTGSPNFPVTAGAFQTTCGGDPPCYYGDTFVTKLNTSGSALVYSTFLGGNDSDVGKGIALDMSGAAYAAGYTQSPNFPTSAGAFQPFWGGGYCGGFGPCPDAFVAKLNIGLQLPNRVDLPLIWNNH